MLDLVVLVHWVVTLELASLPVMLVNLETTPLMA